MLKLPHPLKKFARHLFRKWRQHYIFLTNQITFCTYFKQINIHTNGRQNIMSPVNTVKLEYDYQQIILPFQCFLLFPCFQRFPKLLQTKNHHLLHQALHRRYCRTPSFWERLHRTADIFSDFLKPQYAR